MRSCVTVKKRRIATSPSLTLRTIGHPVGFMIGIPRSCSNRDPVSKSVAIAPQTTTRNRTAVVRMSTDFCDANGSRLSTGTNTTDRKIDPPIQLTAASIWNQTKKTIIAAANPLMNPRYS